MDILQNHAAVGPGIPARGRAVDLQLVAAGPEGLQQEQLQRADGAVVGVPVPGTALDDQPPHVEADRFLLRGRVDHQARK